MGTRDGYVCLTIILVFLSQPGVSNEKDIIGLFTLTNCNRGFEFDCENALFNEERFSEHVKSHTYSDGGKLCIKDSKNDHDEVINILLPFVLTKEPSVNVLCRDNTTLQFKLSEGFILFTYMSFLLTRIAIGLVVPFQDVFVIGVTEEPMYPAYYSDNNRAVYSYEASFGEKMHKNEFIKLKTDLNVSYGAMVNLRNSPRGNDELDVTTCNDDSAFCLYTREKPQDCYKEVDIDVGNRKSINNTMNLLSKNNISFVILSGEGYLQQIFQKNAGIKFETSRRFFFVMYQTKSISIPKNPGSSTNFENNDVLLNFPGSFAVNNLWYFISDLSKLLTYNKDVIEGFLQVDQVQSILLGSINCFVIKLVDKTYTCMSPITYKIWRSIPTSYRKQIVKEQQKNPVILESLIKLMKQRFYIANIDYERLMIQHIFNPSVALQAKPYCNLHIPRCTKGHQIFHSFFKEADWKRSYGWHCRKCLAGYYKKSDKNDDQCIPCNYPYVTNIEHSSCYDPYQMFNHQINDTGNAILIGLSSTLTLCLLVTIFVFLKYRDTPIVLSANRTMTMLQLSMHFVLATIPLILFFHNHSKLTCKLNQIFIGFGFAITISVNICKTQKIFIIISKNILMSKKEILLTKMSEWIIIFSVVCLNGLFQLLTLMNKDITIKLKYIDDVLEKECYCSNHLGVYLQITFATILATCNGVQGFRGRRLPSQFKETTHVIYSSFISLVVFFAATTVYFTAKRESEKEFVTMVTVTVLNVVHFMLLYAYKVYLIIFRSETNTKTVFNTRRWKEVEDMTTMNSTL